MKSDAPHSVTGETDDAPGLASVEPVWEGKGKALECNLYVGAYNYFPLDNFVAHLKSIAWEEPEFIQLFVQEQEDMEFRIVKITEADPGTENGKA
jgi:hypothetical protein